MPLILCPDCGREISDAAPACIHCGRPTEPHAEDGPSRVPVVGRGEPAPMCGNCHRLLDFEAVWRGGQVLCPCGARYEFVARAQPAAGSTFNPGVAAVLSLVIPGAGQMYRGNIGAGLLWLVGVVAGYMMLALPGVVLHLLCIFSAARR